LDRGLSADEVDLFAGYIVAARRLGCVIEPLPRRFLQSCAQAERVRDAILRHRLVRERAAGWRVEMLSGSSLPGYRLAYGMVGRQALTTSAVIPASLRGGCVFADAHLTLGDQVLPDATAEAAWRAVDSVGLALSALERIVHPATDDPHEGTATDFLSPTWVSVGPKLPVGGLATAEVTVERNGTAVVRGTVGSSAAQIGRRLLGLSRQLATIGQRMPPGATVLLNWMPSGVPVSAGDIIAVSLDGSVAALYRCGQG